MNCRSVVFIFLCIAALATGCANRPTQGQFLSRAGDEIVVCGQLVHTGAPVVTWMDPGGYDGYRVERRFVSFDQADWTTSAKASTDLKTPNRYSLRKDGLTSDQIEQVRGGGWTLPMLRAKVDQFVLHYDVAGT